MDEQRRVEDLECLGGIVGDENVVGNPPAESDRVFLQIVAEGDFLLVLLIFLGIVLEENAEADQLNHLRPTDAQNREGTRDSLGEGLLSLL